MIVFPLCAFGATATFHYAERNTDGGITLDGGGQVIGSASGRWLARVVNVRVHNRATHKLIRALDATLQGRLNPILVQYRAYQRQPFPPEQPTPYPVILNASGAAFSNGSPGYYKPVILAKAAAGADLSAATVSIAMQYGGDLEAGQYFSHKGHLYQIRRIETVSGATTTVKVRPVLREAIAAGDTLDFDRPACAMRLVDDNAMRLDGDRHSILALDFEEDY